MKGHVIVGRGVEKKRHRHERITAVGVGVHCVYDERERCNGLIGWMTPRRENKSCKDSLR